MAITCHFCAAPAHGLCAWPAEQWVERQAGDLVVGEVMRRHKESAADLTHVITVRDLTLLDTYLLKVTVSIKPMMGPKMERSFEVNTFSLVRVQRKAPCGKPVCESCLQARAPGVYVCRDHWNSWQAVA